MPAKFSRYTVHKFNRWEIIAIVFITKRIMLMMMCMQNEGTTDETLETPEQDTTNTEEKETQEQETLELPPADTEEHPTTTDDGRLNKVKVCVL